jgi:capsular polysaccharide biosynthesis protein
MSVAKNITIQKIIAILLHRIKFIVIVTLIGGVLFFGYSKLLITPMYTTSSMIAVQNYDSTGGKNDEYKKIYGSDISGSSTLAGVCVTLFQNSDDLTALYDGCGVSMSCSDFFITITVVGSDPQKCANVANQISEKTKDIYSDKFPFGQVSTVREAKVPSSPDSPNNIKNGLLGFVVGLALSCVISILLELIDTTIKVDDDIQSIYGIPVFAEIPDFESQG